MNVENSLFEEIDPSLPTSDPNYGRVVGPGVLNSYFSVMVCSSRAAGPGFNNDLEPTLKRISTEGRYVTVFSGSEFDPADYDNTATASTPDEVVEAASDLAAAEDLKDLLSEGGALYNRYTDMPGCFLNIERQPVTSGRAGWTLAAPVTV